MYPRKLLKVLGNKPGGYAFMTLEHPRAIHACFLLLLATDLGEIVLSPTTISFLQEQKRKHFEGRDSLTITFGLSHIFRPNLFVLALHHKIVEAVWIKVTQHKNGVLLLQAADGEQYYSSFGCYVDMGDKGKIIYPVQPNKLPPMVSSYANLIYT
jgi:hypothetical protein